MNDSNSGGAHVAEPRGSSTLEPKGKASRQRGLLAFSRGMKAEIRVWALPVAKLGAFLFALGCVAMLGERAEEKGRLGVEPDASALRQEARDKVEDARARAAEAVGVSTQQPAGKEGAPSATAPCATPEPKKSASSGLLPDGRVVLNEATIDDFRKLPGVGQRRAEALLALREKLGKFKKLTDLLRVKGIGPKSLAKFKEMAVLDRPSEPATTP